jgi:hypothetical protein
MMMPVYEKISKLVDGERLKVTTVKKGETHVAGQRVVFQAKLVAIRLTKKVFAKSRLVVEITTRVEPNLESLVEEAIRLNLDSDLNSPIRHLLATGELPISFSYLK